MNSLGQAFRKGRLKIPRLRTVFLSLVILLSLAGCKSPKIEVTREADLAIRRLGYTVHPRPRTTWLLTRGTEEQKEILINLLSDVGLIGSDQFGAEMFVVHDEISGVLRELAVDGTDWVRYAAISFICRSGNRQDVSYLVSNDVLATMPNEYVVGLAEEIAGALCQPSNEKDEEYLIGLLLGEHGLPAPVSAHAALVLTGSSDGIQYLKKASDRDAKKNLRAYDVRKTFEVLEKAEERVLSGDLRKSLDALKRLELFYDIDISVEAVTYNTSRTRARVSMRGVRRDLEPEGFSKYNVTFSLIGGVWQPSSFFYLGWRSATKAEMVR